MSEILNNGFELARMCEHGNFRENCLICTKSKSSKISALSELDKQLSVKNREKIPDIMNEHNNNESKIIELKSRVMDILDSAITEQEKLSQRLEEFYHKKGIKKLEEGDEYALLHAMTEIGINQDQEIRDSVIDIGVLDKIKSKAELYFDNLLTVNPKIENVNILMNMIDKLEKYINLRISDSKKFVSAIESGTDRIEARKLLHTVDDFNFSLKA